MRYLTFLVVAFALFVVALFAPLMAQQDIGDPSTPQTLVLNVARKAGIADKLSVSPMIVRIRENGSQSRSVEVRFREKAGYRFSDLAAFLTRIEADNPSLLIASMNYGQRDEGTDIWRPLVFTVHDLDPASKDPKPVSALKRIDDFLGALDKAKDAATGVTIDRLDFSGQAVTWDMRYRGAADRFETELKLKDAASSVSRGKVTVKDGMVFESGVRWSRAP